MERGGRKDLELGAQGGRQRKLCGTERASWGSEGRAGTAWEVAGTALTASFPFAQGSPGADGPPGRDGAAGVKVSIWGLYGQWDQEVLPLGLIGQLGVAGWSQFCVSLEGPFLASSGTFFSEPENSLLTG